MDDTKLELAEAVSYNMELREENRELRQHGHLLAAQMLTLANQLAEHKRLNLRLAERSAALERQIARGGITAEEQVWQLRIHEANKRGDTMKALMLRQDAENRGFRNRAWRRRVKEAFDWMDAQQFYSQTSSQKARAIALGTEPVAPEIARDAAMARRRDARDRADRAFGAAGQSPDLGVSAINESGRSPA